MEPPAGIVVAGAGLAGCLAAVTAARQGHKVDVYELRQDSRCGRRLPQGAAADAWPSGGAVTPPRDAAIPAMTPRADGSHKAWAGRSINLALSTRGLTALAGVGLDAQVQALGVPMYGRMLHTVGGETSEQLYGTSRAQHLLSVSRRVLNELLCDTVEREPNATLHFEHKIVSVDLPPPRGQGMGLGEPRCAVGVQDLSSTSGGDPELVEAGLLIGADGAWSKVRQAMQRDPHTRLDFRLDYCPHSYKELCIPAGVDGAHVLPPNYLHIWPRGEFMLIALPDLEGSFTCTLFIPQKQIEAEGLDDDGQPNRRQRVSSFFDKWFPDVVPHMPTLVADFLQNPTLPLVTIRCAPFHHEHSGACVILGDAAHAIVPFYGQGCNAAFEDVRVLGELLQCVSNAGGAAGASGDRPAVGDGHGHGNGGGGGGGESRFRSVCEDFTRLRKPNADAIAELALEHYADMGVATLSPLFLLRRAAENAVGRLLSGWYMSEYHMVSFSASIPYADARARAVANELAIGRLVTVGMVGGAVALAGGVWAFLRPIATSRGYSKLVATVSDQLNL